MERGAADAEPRGRGASPAVQALSGPWRIAADPENRGRDERWCETARPDAQPAPVPGIIQQVFPTGHGLFWYYVEFTPVVSASAHERILLRFGAVDYLADVWLNGRHIGRHEGGETPFDLDTTQDLETGRRNLLAVRVLNPTRAPIDGIRLDETPHRNKRCHDEFTPGSGFNTGGIILPVSLEVVPALRIADIFARPDCATGRIDVTVTLRNDCGESLPAQLRASATPASEGRTLASVAAELRAPSGECARDLVLELDQPRRWDLDAPHLYRVSVELEAELGGAPVHHDLLAGRVDRLLHVAADDVPVLPLADDPVQLPGREEQRYVARVERDRRTVAPVVPRTDLRAPELRRGQLLRQRLGVGIAAGVLAGAIVVKVVGLTVVMGVATGIVTAACTFSKVTEALTEARPRPQATS